MKIVFIGDVVAHNGIELLRKGLPEIKRDYNADVCVVNGENSHDTGTGMKKRELDLIFSCGADAVTGGNHSLRKEDVDFYLENQYALCPANFLSRPLERGYCVVDKGRESLRVINLVGTAFMEAHRSPFLRLDDILDRVDCKNILLDFHAESTREKGAMAYYSDGRISAVVGTHTHIQTNDERIFPGGTGFITDAGAVCALDSVLGVEPEKSVQRQRFLMHVRFRPSLGPGFIHGVFLETDRDGKCTKIEKIKRFVERS